jgi:hypothetical protein
MYDSRDYSNSTTVRLCVYRLLCHFSSILFIQTTCFLSTTAGALYFSTRASGQKEADLVFGQE